MVAGSSNGGRLSFHSARRRGGAFIVVSLCTGADSVARQVAELAEEQILRDFCRSGLI